MLKVKDVKNNIDYNKIKLILTQNKKFSEITISDNPKMGGTDNMKFDAIVGNPPYQINDGGAQNSATPIYQKFVKISKELTSIYTSLIIPTRWFAGGKHLNDFREEMLNDKTIQQLDDFLHPEELFSQTNNRGGVCYFLGNKNYDNRISKVKVISHINKNNIFSCYRDMKNPNVDIFIRSQVAVDILNKVIKNNSIKNMKTYISPRKPFGIESNILKTKMWNTTKKDLKEPIKCIGKGFQIGYIEKSNVLSHKEWINIWKVFVPRANNVGTELNDDNINTYIGEPKTICTEAYIMIGIELNLNKTSAINLSKYFKTKFARFMHGIAKASHDASRDTYRFVPVQNFTNKSDINWNGSIKEIDKQLYNKYKLTKEEIKFIESMIKPME